MIEKIKQISWISWIGLVVGAFLLTALGSYLTGLFNYSTIAPWEVGNVVASKIAIEIFSSGTGGDKVYVAQRLAAIVGILIYFIIGPGLLILFGFEKRDDKEEKPAKGTMAAFMTGIVFTLAALIWLGGELTVGEIVKKNTRISASESAKKDEIRHNLATLATESYEYLVLPEKLGGGGGSFENLSIEDLNSFREIESGNYRFGETDSDTLLRIIGSDMPDYSYNTADTSEVEVIIQVMPSDILLWEKNE